MFIDPREGSASLLKPLQRLGITAVSKRLVFGDVEFQGLGPTGLVRVGLEYKTLSDLLNAIASARFVGHQLRGLVHEYPVRYLLIEGVWTVDRTTGLLQVRARVKRNGRYMNDWIDAGFGRRRWSYHALVEFLNGLPVRVIRTGSPSETHHAIFGLHAWWSKPWDKHGAMKVIYNGVQTRSGTGDLGDEFVPMAAILTKISDTRRVFAAMPGVGWEYSAAAEDAFGSIRVAALADAASWADLRADGTTGDGRRRPRLGLRRAIAVVAALRGSR
jgi:ERCC4-type nuclease